MAKTRRLIAENLKNVDVVIELLDARIPKSSRNPEIKTLCGDKPRLLLLNKASLADPEQNRIFVKELSGDGVACLLTDCQTGAGFDRIEPTVKELLKEKIERYEAKGMNGRRLRAMILGIPNVGKSSFINKVAGAHRAKVENRPGVTLDKQWVSTKIGLDLLDMPGILWPKFDDRTVGENLAITGAIKDAVVDTYALGCALCGKLAALYPALLSERYKLGDMAAYRDLKDYELLDVIGKKRGFLVSGGEVDGERAAKMLLEEFRSLKIGRITLDRLS